MEYPLKIYSHEGGFGDSIEDSCISCNDSLTFRNAPMKTLEANSLQSSLYDPIIGMRFWD
jgi:hypothetical protein